MQSLACAEKDVIFNGAVSGAVDVPIMEARVLFSAGVGDDESRFFYPCYN